MRKTEEIRKFARAEDKESRKGKKRRSRGSEEGRKGKESVQKLISKVGRRKVALI